MELFQQTCLLAIETLGHGGTKNPGPPMQKTSAYRGKKPLSATARKTPIPVTDRRKNSVTDAKNPKPPTFIYFYPRGFTYMN